MKEVLNTVREAQTKTFLGKWIDIDLYNDLESYLSKVDGEFFVFMEQALERYLYE